LPRATQRLAASSLSTAVPPLASGPVPAARRGRHPIIRTSTPARRAARAAVRAHEGYAIREGEVRVGDDGDEVFAEMNLARAVHVSHGAQETLPKLHPLRIVLP